jgi:hypothetical protein
MVRGKAKDVSNDTKAQLISYLIDKSYLADGKRVFEAGAVRSAAGKFEMSERNVRRLWKIALENRVTMGVYTATTQRVGNCGRHLLYNREELLSELEQVPHYMRGNQRAIAARLGVSVGTINGMIKMEKIIHPHSNSIKPLLTEQNMAERVGYAADRIAEDPRTGKLYYKPTFDEVHVDEKWFFLSPESQRTYLTPN